MRTPRRAKKSIRQNTADNKVYQKFWLRNGSRLHSAGCNHDIPGQWLYIGCLVHRFSIEECHMRACCCSSIPFRASMELHACEQTLSIGCKAAYTATMINVSSMLSMRIKSTCAHAVLQYHGLHFPFGCPQSPIRSDATNVQGWLPHFDANGKRLVWAISIGGISWAPCSVHKYNLIFTCASKAGQVAARDSPNTFTTAPSQKSTFICQILQGAIKTSQLQQAQVH